MRVNKTCDKPRLERANQLTRGPRDTEHHRTGRHRATPNYTARLSDKYLHHKQSCLRT